MIQASRPLPAAPLHPASLGRRPVRHFGLRIHAIPLAVPEARAPSRWPISGEDLRFFLACYVAGVAFFLVMLS